MQQSRQLIQGTPDMLPTRSQRRQSLNPWAMILNSGLAPPRQSDTCRSFLSAQKLEYDDLVKDARGVLDDLAPIRREVRGRTNAWYDVRLRPYRTIEDKIDGTFA
jgi:hypothetical protein